MEEENYYDDDETVDLDENSLENNELMLENAFCDQNTVYLIKIDGTYETITVKNSENAQKIVELLKDVETQE